MMRLTVCSLLLLAACAGIPRPNSDACIVNAPGKHLKCYNLLRDYDDYGRLRPDAKATFRPAAQIRDVNKFFAMDPTSFAHLKTYLNQLKDEYARRCQP